MKKIVLGMIGLGLVSNLFALSTADIETKIQEIQNLPAQQRVEQMNQLKEQIANMNSQEREQAILAIKDMQEKMATQTAGMTDKLKSGVTQMSQSQTEMQTKLEANKPEMEPNMPEANRPEMEPNMPEVNTPEMDHEAPEVDHETPEMDHDTPEVDHEIPDTNPDKVETPTHNVIGTK